MAGIVDDFESYTTGDLNGQGSWSGGTGFDVQSSVTNSGSNAVSHTTASSEVISKAFTDATSGTQIVYGRCSDVTSNERWSVRLRDNGSDRIYVKTNGGNLEYFDGTSYNSIGSISADTWFKLQIDWLSDSTARYTLNDGTPTSYDTFIGTMSGAGFDEFKFISSNHAVNRYWDDLSDGSGGGSPSFIPKVSTY